MRIVFTTLLILILISLSSCRKDFDFEPSIGGLAFSKDTVFLDTVFSRISSSTYTLKVFNKTNKDIKIPKIKLKKTNSKYRMIVDGMTGINGKEFNNVELLAKDSLYIFIETTANISDANPTDFLYTDQIQFGFGTEFQTVELVTLIQDAYFIYPNRFNTIYDEVPIGINNDNSIAKIRGRDLIENHSENGNEFIFKNDKPYVVYGYASVPSGKKLIITAGARIHFHKDSGLIVQQNATLKVNGTKSLTNRLENEVIFEGDRLEPFYSDVPGQWGFIYLRNGSKDNEINNLTLKNASVGLLIAPTQNTTVIKNTQIYDCSNIGVYAQNTSVLGENIVINSAGQVALACTLGGNYNFKHCTFNNNWNNTKQLSVLVDNFFKNENEVIIPFDLVQATFSNCIIYGSNQIEILLNKSNLKMFNYQFNNCIIKFNNTSNQYTNNELYNFTSTNYSNCLIAKNFSQFDPKFFNVSKNKLNIDNKSAAFQKGSNSFLVNLDIIGNLRNSALPDIGAFSNKPFVQ